MNYSIINATSFQAILFRVMLGKIQRQQKRVEPFSRPGVHGQGFRDMGETAAQSILQTVEGMTGSGQADTRMAFYRARLGTLVDITQQPEGETYTDCMVVDVTLNRVDELGLDTLGDYARLFATWTVICTT